MNQVELAEIFDITRSTVTQYQKEGLPFEVRGSENVYRLGVASYWMTGRNFFVQRRMKCRSAAFAVMVGLVLARLMHRTNPEPLPSFVKHTRSFMKEHFGTDTEATDSMTNRALLLVCDY